MGLTITADYSGLKQCKSVMNGPHLFLTNVNLGMKRGSFRLSRNAIIRSDREEYGGLNARERIDPTMVFWSKMPFFFENVANPSKP
jgi:hypothetical protein